METPGSLRAALWRTGDARLGHVHRKRHHRRDGSELVDECLCKPPVCLTRRVAAGRMWATLALSYLQPVSIYHLLSPTGTCLGLFTLHSITL